MNIVLKNKYKYLIYPIIDFFPHYLSLLGVILVISIIYPDPKEFLELLIIKKYLKLNTYAEFAIFFKLLYYFIVFFLALISNGKTVTMMSKLFGNDFEYNLKKEFFHLLLDTLLIWLIFIPNFFIIIENKRIKIIELDVISYTSLIFSIIMILFSIVGVKKQYPFHLLCLNGYNCKK